MKFTADLHIHVDHDEEKDKWHGDRPERIAAGIVNSGIDVFAITEHKIVSERFFNVCEEVAKLTYQTRRNILPLLGVEMTVLFDKHRYHVGYVFKESFSPETLPEVPPSLVDIRDLEHYRIDYPGVAILFHPTWKDHRGTNHEDTTEALMKSELVDGVEILNGSILSNGADLRITQSALKLFLRARNKGANIAAIGASDAHVGEKTAAMGASNSYVGEHNPSKPNMVGTVVTEFYANKQREIFSAILNGTTKALAVSDRAKGRVKDAIKLCKKDPEMRGVRGLNRYIIMP